MFARVTETQFSISLSGESFSLLSMLQTIKQDELTFHFTIHGCTPQRSNDSSHPRIYAFFLLVMNQKLKKDSEQWRSQGRGPGDTASLILRPKKMFLETGPPAYLRALDDRPPSPTPSSEVLNPPLLREKLQLIDRYNAANTGQLRIPYLIRTARMYKICTSRYHQRFCYFLFFQFLCQSQQSLSSDGKEPPKLEFPKGGK